MSEENFIAYRKCVCICYLKGICLQDCEIDILKVYEISYTHIVSNLVYDGHICCENNTSAINIFLNNYLEYPRSCRERIGNNKDKMTMFDYTLACTSLSHSLKWWLVIKEKKHNHIILKFMIPIKRCFHFRLRKSLPNNHL